MLLRQMKGLTGIVLGLAFAFPALAPAQLYESISQSDVDVRVKTRYEDERGGFVELVGVASITPTTIECWDLTGKRSQALVERVRRSVILSRGEFSFKHGTKVRFIIFDRATDDDYIRWLTLKEAGGSFRQLQYGKGGRLDLVQVTTEPEAKTTSVVISIEDRLGKNTLIPYKQGAHATILGDEYTVGESGPDLAKPDPRDEVRLAHPGKLWTLSFRYQRGSSGSTSSLSKSLIGLDRYPIGYVDRQGNPVSAITYLSDPEPEVYSPYSVEDFKKKPEHKYLKAVFEYGQGTEGTMVFKTNVNPAKIGWVLFGYATSKHVQFDPIPLDPKD